MTEDLLRINSLQCEIHALRLENEAFRNGEKYKKLRRDYEMVIRGKDRRIRELEIQIAADSVRHKNLREQWFKDNELWLKEYFKELDKKNRQIEELRDRLVADGIAEGKRAADLIDRFQEEIEKRDQEIKELEVELAHARALLSHDGNNTGLPTSQTPIGKKKRIPNTRVRTGRKKGGQYGHEKHVLEVPAEEEITETVHHRPKADEVCPKCECRSYEYTGEYEDRFEFGFRVIPTKVRHRFHECRCRHCGTLYHTEVEPNLKGDCQYDANVQATILSLLNTTNAAINKVPPFLRAMTNDELRPCEGYVAKVQKRTAKNLVSFREDLTRLMITRELLYWDDTVIMIMTERACLRFYGDEEIAIFFAHGSKDMTGLDEDGILNLLTKKTKVMHDHNKVNYNKKYIFTNVECLIHLLRDLQKNADDTEHTEMKELKELITEMMKKRNDLKEEGRKKFGKKKKDEIREKVMEILDRAEQTNEEYRNRYFKKPEKTLINRVRKHYDNYFMWLDDFGIPTTNNLAERSLRPVKSHMKISGQFESVARADDYAIIRTYIETCRRNGINEIEALIRACNGNPYTVEEIFG